MKDIVDIMEETAKDICRAKQKEIDSGESDESKKDIISLLSECVIRKIIGLIGTDICLLKWEPM